MAFFHVYCNEVTALEIAPTRVFLPRVTVFFIDQNGPFRKKILRALSFQLKELVLSPSNRIIPNYPLKSLLASLYSS